MAQNWDYAELSKDAKVAGGPEKYVEMLELASKEAGKRYEICYVCEQCTHEAKCIRASACDIFRGAVTFAYGS